MRAGDEGGSAALGPGPSSSGARLFYHRICYKVYLKPNQNRAKSHRKVFSWSSPIQIRSKHVPITRSEVRKR